MDKLFCIQSTEHKWRVWLTTNLNQTERERFKDVRNNQFITVPPTDGDRIDILGKEFQHYTYDFKGLVIVIKEGEIKQLIY